MIVIACTDNGSRSVCRLVRVGRFALTATRSPRRTHRWHLCGGFDATSWSRRWLIRVRGFGLALEIAD